MDKSLGNFLADDLAEGFGVGGGSVPAQPSVFPDFDTTGASGTSPAGSKAAESWGGMSEDVSAGGASGVQLADGVPEAYDEAGLGGMLVDGLGNPPRA